MLFVRMSSARQIVGEWTVPLSLAVNRCLPLVASTWFVLIPPWYSYEVFSRSGALTFLPGLSKLFLLSSISSINDSTELWLLALLLRDRTLPFPIPVCRARGGDGQPYGLEPVLLRPDSNVIDSNYTRDLNGNATTSDKAVTWIYCKKCVKCINGIKLEKIFKRFEFKLFYIRGLGENAKKKILEFKYHTWSHLVHLINTRDSGEKFHADIQPCSNLCSVTEIVQVRNLNRVAFLLFTATVKYFKML